MPRRETTNTLRRPQRAALLFLLEMAVLILLMLSGGRAAIAGSAGRIAGTITDSASGRPLDAAAVYLPLLGRGTVTDPQGRYALARLSPGFYTVEISRIGHVRQRRDNIRVFADSTTDLSVALVSTILPLGEEIVVLGRRTLLDVNEPSAQRRVSGKDIELSTASGLTDVVLRQPGVSQVDREVHIRGGRTYEADYTVDGVSVSDPFLRQGMAIHPSPVTVSQLTVQSGGIDPGNGRSSAGLVAVETREPTSLLSGSLSWMNDRLAPTATGNWNSDAAEVVLSGPLRALVAPRASSDERLEPGFVLDVGGLLTDTHLGSGHPYSSVWGGRTWAPRSDNTYHLLAKLAWRPSPRHRLVFLHSAETAINQDPSLLDTRLRTAVYSYGWPFAYARHLAGYDTVTRQANAQLGRWEFHAGEKTSLSVTASRVFSRLHADANGKRPDQYAPPQDTGPVAVVPTPDSTFFTVYAGDGFYDIGDGDLWYDHFIETCAIKSDCRIEPRPNWRLVSGFEGASQTLQVVDIFRPWLGLGGLNTDAYRARPASAAWWCQGRFNFQGAVLDVGLRAELWWPGSYLEGAVEDTLLPNITPGMRRQFQRQTFPLFGRRARGWILPRIGVSYALNPSASVFVTYDRLAQRPNPRYLYAKLRTRSPATFQLFGNPALGPERTTAMETGVKLLRGPDWALTWSVYQRDIHDYIAATVVVPDPASPGSFWYAYANRDWAQARGMEVTVDGRVGSSFRTTAMLSVSRVTGEHSLPSDIFRGRTSREGEELFNEIRLDWDKPWRASIEAGWSYGPDDRPRLLGLGLWNNWNLNFSVGAEAGKRYTPYADSLAYGTETVYYRAGSPNSALGPYWSSLDLVWQKHFPVGRTLLSFIVQVSNLLNHRNVSLINPLTGKGYKAGDKIPTGDNFFETAPEGYHLPIWNDPAAYEKPVHWQFGLKWSW